MMAAQFFWFGVLMAVNGLLVFVLTANVSKLRIRKQISLGDGGDEQLSQAMRAHGNAIEQLPVFALMILALTVLGAEPWLLAVMVVVFTVARFLHAYGMLANVFPGRRYGAALSYLMQLSASLATLVYVFI